MRVWLRRLLAAIVLGACAAPALAVDESDLLPVDDAFALSVRATSADTVALHWRIADGYYLYRHRISVQADAGFDGAKLQLPHGDRHHDEFFGDVETFRHEVNAVLPGGAHGGTVTLQVKYQGCADVGVCYPPQKRTLTVALPAGDATVGDSTAADTVGTAPDAAFAALGKTLADGARSSAPMLGTAPGGGSAALPLPPEQAFGFEAIVGDGNTLLLRFTPAKGYYLYRDKTTLHARGDGIAAGAPRWPPGQRHRDEHFGDVVVYFDQVDVPLPLLRTRADAGPVALTATFQGCQLDGICYPPMTRTLTLALPKGV
jgi:thiol:disulfide interchange protein DsbD